MGAGQPINAKGKQRETNIKSNDFRKQAQLCNSWGPQASQFSWFITTISRLVYGSERWGYKPTDNQGVAHCRYCMIL